MKIRIFNRNRGEKKQTSYHSHLKLILFNKTDPELKCRSPTRHETWSQKGMIYRVNKDKVHF